MGLIRAAKLLGCASAFVWNMKRHNEDYLALHKEPHSMRLLSSALKTWQFTIKRFNN
jgi:hypothetical protein